MSEGQVTLLSTIISQLNQSVDRFDGSLIAADLIREQFSHAFKRYPYEARLKLSYIRHLVQTNKKRELEATVDDCMTLYPNNNWIVLQSVESLIAVRSYNVFAILSKFYSVTEIVDERRWILVFNSLRGLFYTTGSYIEYLKSLLTNKSNDFYLCSKLGQLYYIQHDYDLSLDALVRASHYRFLRSSSLIILSESALFLGSDKQKIALKMLISANKRAAKLELFHHICLFSILTQQVDESISIFLSDYHYHLSSWEVLHWFNRLPFDITQGLKIFSSLEEYHDQHKQTLDWRWHYHYSIALMLQSRIAEASLVLRSLRSSRSDVSELQSILHSLCNRLTINIPSICQPVDWKSDFNPNFIDSCSDVIVLFSGWTGALGYLSDFTVTNYFHRLGFNVLILRDPTLKFFSEGIAPSQFSTDSVTDLNHYLLSRTSGGIYFIGDSISALAAIHHASLIPTDVKVIAFSPVLSKSDYSSLGINHFDDNIQPRSDKDLQAQTRGHQSLIRIEATRNLYPHTIELLRNSKKNNLHVVYSELNTTDSLVAEYLEKEAQATLHCKTKSHAHVISNEFVATDNFNLLLKRIKNHVSNASRFKY